MKDFGGPAEPLSVSELNRRVKRILEGRFPQVNLVAETSGVRLTPAGHLFFSLKDDQSEIRAVLWKDRVRKLTFDLEEGLEVIVRGALRVFQKRGTYQVEIQEIVPKGIGALQLAYKQLFARLEREGLFHPSQKKALPRFPMKIGLVTSPTSAAIADMLRVLFRRAPRLKVLVAPVRVQGEGSANEIASAIRCLNRNVAQLDLLIVGRGGGSPEDLWAFNEEEVARAIFESQIPVVSAVGHEIDTTIADHVADRRAQTPTEAAEISVPDWSQILSELDQRKHSLRMAFQGRIVRDQDRLVALSQHPVLLRPLEGIQDCVQAVEELALDLRRGLGLARDRARGRLEVLESRPVLVRPLAGVAERLRDLGRSSDRLDREALLRVEKMRNRLEGLQGRLESLSPRSVIQRGYSLTTTQEGKVVMDASSLEEGQRVRTCLARGEFESRVETTQLPASKAAGALSDVDISAPGETP